jgi:hypothetical protein
MGWQERAQLGHSRHQGQLCALDAELARVDTGIDHYLRAFETGTMPESICGERVMELDLRASSLRASSTRWGPDTGIITSEEYNVNIPLWQ